MIEKFAFSVEESGFAPHLAYKTLVYVSAILSAAVMWQRFSSTAWLQYAHADFMDFIGKFLRLLSLLALFLFGSKATIVFL